MHVNGKAPLEASTGEAPPSAYSRITVQLQEATENAFAKRPPCLLHFDDALKICICTCYIFDLENVQKRKKDSSGSIPFYLTLDDQIITPPPKIWKDAVDHLLFHPLAAVGFVSCRLHTKNQQSSRWKEK